MKSHWQTRYVTNFWRVWILRVALLAVPGAELSAADNAALPAIPEFQPFEHVKEKAAALAAKPYGRDTPELPPFLLNLDYDQYRDLRFRPDQSLWRDNNNAFQVQFFSRGSIFRERVLVHVIEQGMNTPVQFSPTMFDFGRLPVPMEVPADLGFAGFRLHYLLNVHQYFDEVVAFLGASYFRAVGRGEIYGLSARGLAVDTGLPRGEEFPVFREFWLEKPVPGSQQITVYALLDSASVTGAYRFVINPGASTDMAVSMQLYFRTNVEKLGVAPLTSMYFHGKTTQHFVDDFRPEVHDSDGLLIESGNGEQIWRPLNNPQRLAFSSFSIQNPRGFGLLQRERNFSRYQDLEAKYQRRPSAWITPIGDWGSGHVELVEIPSNGEVDDNIVAFWVPAEPITAGSSRSFEYKLSFGEAPSLDFLGGRVVFTGIGPGRHADEGRRLFVVDFAGGELPRMPETAEVIADISSSSGTLGMPVVERNPIAGGYRVFFEFTPGGEPLADLRCSLRSGDKTISETWIYQTWKEKY